MSESRIEPEARSADVRYHAYFERLQWTPHECPSCGHVGLCAVSAHYFFVLDRLTLRCHKCKHIWQAAESPPLSPEDEKAVRLRVDYGHMLMPDPSDLDAVATYLAGAGADASAVRTTKKRLVAAAMSVRMGDLFADDESLPCAQPADDAATPTPEIPTSCPHCQGQLFACAEFSDGELTAATICCRVCHLSYRDGRSERESTESLLARLYLMLEAREFVDATNPWPADLPMAPRAENGYSAPPDRIEVGGPWPTGADDDTATETWRDRAPLL